MDPPGMMVQTKCWVCRSIGSVNFLW